MNKQPLKIYKASAGSGKTYRLALEYIKLVISNPWCYDKILAVTFTNKATKEMKNRILKELYGISNNLPDSKSMIKSISEELSDNEAFNVAVDEFINTIDPPLIFVYYMNTCILHPSSLRFLSPKRTGVL